MVDDAQVIRLLNATGARRRLQALVAIGHSPEELADELRILPDKFARLLHGQLPYLREGTHQRIVALFVERWARPRTGASAERARALAKVRRWVGPLAWDDLDDWREVPNTRGEQRRPEDPPLIDEVAIELAIAGEGVALTRPERLYALARLHAERWSDARIAEAIGVTERTVFRNRKDLHLEAFDQTEIKKVTDR